MDRKSAFFSIVIGPTTCALICNLSSAAQTTKTLEEIINVLNSQFNPKPSLIVERYKFNSRVWLTDK